MIKSVFYVQKEWRVKQRKHTTATDSTALGFDLNVVDTHWLRGDALEVEFVPFLSLCRFYNETVSLSENPALP